MVPKEMGKGAVDRVRIQRRKLSESGFGIESGTVPVVRLPHFDTGQPPGLDIEYAAAMGECGFPGNEVMHASKAVGRRTIHTSIIPFTHRGVKQKIVSRHHH